MKLFLFAYAVVSASAVSADWNYMSQSTACIDTQFAGSGSTLTCALPTHTSYDKAYTMAASLPACTANSYDCYNDKYCR